MANQVFEIVKEEFDDWSNHRSKHWKPEVYEGNDRPNYKDPGEPEVVEEELPWWQFIYLEWE